MKEASEETTKETNKGANKETNKGAGQGARAGDAAGLRLVSIDHVLERGLPEISERLGRRAIRRPDQLLREVQRYAERRLGVRVDYDPHWYVAVEEVWNRLSNGGRWRLDWARALEQVRQLQRDEDFLRQQEALLSAGGVGVDVSRGAERFAMICKLFEQSGVLGVKREQWRREALDGLLQALSRGGVAGGLGYGIGLGVMEVYGAARGSGPHEELFRRRYARVRDKALGKWERSTAEIVTELTKKFATEEPREEALEVTGVKAGVELGGDAAARASSVTVPERDAPVRIRERTRLGS